MARPASSRYLKLDVGHFVEPVRSGLLFRSAWGIEPGLPVAVDDPIDKIDMRGRKHVTPEELALDHSRIAVVPVEQPAGSNLVHDGANRDDYTANYIGMIEHCGQALARVIATMASQVGAGGSVVGCSIGRDRTGVVTALTLRGLGLPVPMIVTAEAAMREELAALIEVSPYPFLGLTRDQVVGRLRAPHESIADVIEACEQRWNSVPDYLARHGLAAPAWRKLSASLLVSHPWQPAAGPVASAP